MRRIAVVALAAVLGALAARAAPARAAACGSGTLTLHVAGRARTVVLHVPGGVRPGTRVPLVLDLHGSGSTAAQQEAFSGLDATADANGFVVAYPQALIRDGGGFDWNVPDEPLIGGRTVPRGAADDVAFLTGLVQVLERRGCVDPNAVYATGFSGGARMVSQLACDAPTVFAAVAPVSGLRRPSRCTPKRAVPIVAFHGTADPVDPFDGHGQAYWTYSVPVAAADWARTEGCSSRLSKRAQRSVTLTRYASCKDGSVVELYAIAGEGHEWPGGPHLPPRYTAFLGAQSNAIDADAAMWAFFAAHRLH